MHENVNVKYVVRILQGKDEGKVFEYEFDLDDFECDSLDSLIFEKGHWTSMGYGSDYYEVLERVVMS